MAKKKVPPPGDLKKVPPPGDLVELSWFFAESIPHGDERVELQRALVELLCEQGDLDVAYTYASSIEKADAQKAIALATVSASLALAGDAARAESVAEEARTVALGLHKPEDRALTLGALALLEDRAGHEDQARELLTQAAEETAQLSDAVRDALAKGAVASYASSCGNKSQARKLFTRAFEYLAYVDASVYEEVAQQLCVFLQAGYDLPYTPRCYTESCIDCIPLFEIATDSSFDPALLGQAQKFDKALEQARSREKQHGSFAFVISHELRRQGYRDTAFYERLYDFARDVDPEIPRAMALIHVAAAYHGAGDDEMAQKLFSRARREALTLDDRDDQSAVLVEVGTGLHTCGMVEFAGTVFAAAEEIAAEVGGLSTVDRAKALWKVAIGMAETGRGRDAIRISENYPTLKFVDHLHLRGPAQQDIVLGMVQYGDLDLALEYSPSVGDDAVAIVVVALVASGRFDEAEVGLAALSKGKSTEGLRCVLVESYAEGGRFDEALEMAQAITGRGARAEAFCRLARVALTTVDDDAARAALAKKLADAFAS